MLYEVITASFTLKTNISKVVLSNLNIARITSYNVCYTKLLRERKEELRKLAKSRFRFFTIVAVFVTLLVLRNKNGVDAEYWNPVTMRFVVRNNFV